MGFFTFVCCNRANLLGASRPGCRWQDSPNAGCAALDNKVGTRRGGIRLGYHLAIQGFNSNCLVYAPRSAKLGYSRSQNQPMPAASASHAGRHLMRFTRLIDMLRGETGHAVRIMQSR